MTQLTLRMVPFFWSWLNPLATPLRAAKKDAQSATPLAGRSQGSLPDWLRRGGGGLEGGKVQDKEGSFRMRMFESFKVNKKKHQEA